MFGEAVRDLLDPRLRGGEESHGTTNEQMIPTQYYADLLAGQQAVPSKHPPFFVAYLRDGGLL